MQPRYSPLSNIALILVALGISSCSAAPDRSETSSVESLAVITNPTLGFKNGVGDISVVSVFPSGVVVAGYGATITASLWNIGCPSGQAGTVDFFWVPLNGTSTFLGNVLAMDGQQNTDIQPGQSLDATYLWVPTTPGKGHIVTRAHAILSAQCPGYDPPNFNPPASATSGVVNVRATP